MNTSKTGSHYNDDAAVTEALPAPVRLGVPDEEAPASFTEDLTMSPPDDEPFIPKKRYSPGRSTKVLVCVLLVVSGIFGGSAIQKQIDQGNRAARTNVGNFQGTNPRTGNGAGTNDGSGTQTPGQGRRGGNSNTTAPTTGTGQ